MEDMILSIETTDFCNLNCIMCPPQNERKSGLIKNRGHLDYHAFKLIIDSIVYNHMFIKNILLHWLGEPFLNPSLIQMLNYAINKAYNNFSQIRFDTNLNTSIEALNKLIEISNSKVFLSISLDASNEKTYNKIRIGGNFNKVIRNIKHILNNRKEGPLLGFQFIVMPENYKETEKFIKMCYELLKEKKKKGDFITIKRESYSKAGKRKEYLDHLYNTTIKNLNLKSGYYKGVYLNISEETDGGITKTF